MIGAFGLRDQVTPEPLNEAHDFTTVIRTARNPQRQYCPTIPACGECP